MQCTKCCLHTYMQTDRRTDRQQEEIRKRKKKNSQFKASTALTIDQSRRKMENIYIEDRSILLPSDVVLIHH
jgi:hypothetical protein